MSLEHDLVEVLGRTAAAHRPAAPDLAAVRTGARQRARRRTLLRVGVGVVAALVVVLASLPLLLREDAPREPQFVVPSLGELAIGTPPRVPYCADGRTVVDGDVEVRARCDVLVTRGGSTLYLGGRRGVEQLVDGRRVLLDRSGASHWFPAVSNDGAWSVWLTDEGRQPHLVVADLRRHQVVRRVRWPSANGWVPGIDDLGRAYSVDFDSTRVRAYDLRTDEAFPVTGAPEHGSPGIRFVAPDGFGIRPGNPVGPVVVGTVTTDGEFVGTHETAWDYVHWSPDRSRVARFGDDGMVVSAADGSSEVRLRIPDRGSPTWLPVWEDANHVLVQFDPYAEPGVDLTTSTGLDAPASRTYLLRCSADTGECEVALAPGWGGDLGHPAYR